PRRTARSAPAPDRRRPALGAAGRGIREWWSAAWRSWFKSPEDGVDGIAGGAPGGAPFVQDGAACGGDPVVAPRRAGHRRLDVAVQQPGCAEVAQHRIQRALLAAEHAVAEALQPLGDLVAVHRLPGRLQYRQQHQRHGAAAELLLELAQLLSGGVGIWIRVAHGGAPVVRVRYY